MWRPLGRPFGEKAKSDGTETAYGHGMRPGHSGSPALSTLPTAWRAPTRGAPVTAEGWGHITPPKGEKETRHHTALADRTVRTNSGPQIPIPQWIQQRSLEFLQAKLCVRETENSAYLPLGVIEVQLSVITMDGEMITEDFIETRTLCEYSAAKKLSPMEGFAP